MTPPERPHDYHMTLYRSLGFIFLLRNVEDLHLIHRVSVGGPGVSASTGKYMRIDLLMSL